MKTINSRTAGVQERSSRVHIGARFLLAMLALSLPCVLPASTIQPVSYSYTGGTPAGEFSYTDVATTKLTDGDLGTPVVGDGTWVGFQFGDSGAAQILFTFGSSYTFSDVAFNFLRSDTANTQLPENVTIGTSVFPTADFATDSTEGFVHYTGSWTGDTLTVSLNHSMSHWIFVNEAQFTQAQTTGSVIPEPGTIGFVVTGLASVLLWQRRRSLRSSRPPLS